MPPILAILLASILAPLGRAEETALRARALLEQAKEATGGAAWDRVKALRSVTVFERAGRTSERESLADLNTGFYVTAELQVGAAGRRVKAGARDGFDGRFGWQEVWGLIVLQPDQREAHTAAYMKSKGYFFPSRRSAEIRYLGERKGADGRRVHAVSLRPEGGSAVELELDALTHRPSAEVYAGGAGGTVVRYGDYREVGGLAFAFRADLESADGAKLAAVTREVALDPEVSADSFERPSVAFSFQGGAGPADVPARRGVIVEALVGGKGPFPFVLDTGGRAQMTPALAAAAGLAVEDRVARAPGVTIGALTLRGAAFEVRPALGPAVEVAVPGEAAVGLLGVETFLSLAVAVDARRNAVRFMAPREFAPPEGAARLPLQFVGSKPAVDGELEGEKARFILDTGSNAEVVVFPRLAERMKAKLPHGTAAKTIVGFASVAAERTRGKGLRLGGLDLGEAEVLVVDGAVPGLPDADGIVGMGVLGRSPVAFDYNWRSVYLGP